MGSSAASRLPSRKADADGLTTEMNPEEEPL
jgi:hypothetical protein